MLRFHILLLLSAAWLTAGCSEPVTLEQPRCEMQEQPLGVAVANPVFSWHLDSEAFDVVQTAYEISVAASEKELGTGAALWNSGRVDSDAMRAAYAGAPLDSGRDYYWSVRAHTNAGSTAWSAPHRFSTALSDDEWRAVWVGEDALSNPDENRDSLHTRLAARYLRKEFDNGRKAVKRAMLYVSGLGTYEAYLNGERIGDDFLAPAITFYTKTVYYNTYDVTRLLRRGDNALGVILGNGRYFWLRAQGKPIAGFGLPRLLAQLEIEYADGSRRTVATDDTWRVTSHGPIVANNEYDGEEYDMRRELPGWNRAGYDDAGWQSVDLMEAPAGRLCAQPCPAIRVMERVRPASITRMPSGKFLVDMGQNLVGRLHAKFSACKDEPVVMRFSELLNADSTLYVANLRSAKATDVFTPAADGRFEWTPAFVFHGFRYIELSGMSEMPSADDLEVEVLYDEMNTIGSFETDNDILNSVYSNAYWGIRGNYR
ncbi:MAG: family 78 glycoside hydrolase catalytic domain, partial [Alistipes sp.]|nr:family 78 glycoside hydrolase catalytic domain [Alistipes sp.]